MAGNAFIKFGSNVDGESLQDGLPGGSKNWVDIGDWSWEVEAESSFLKGGGAAVGKATPGALSISKFYDKSSPVTYTNLVKGVHFPEVLLIMMKQTGQGKLEEYYRMTMKYVFITKVATKGGEDGAVSQDIDMVFKEIKIEYKYQDHTKEGALNPAGQFEWDIAKNTVK